MKTTNIKRSIAGVKTRKGLGALALIVGAASLLPATGANAHGYISSPKSRVIMCKENGIESPSHPACIAAKAAGNQGLYTPQEVAVGGVRDDHQNFIPDGRLCSVGRSNLYGMDLARTDWPATNVTSGFMNFVWTNTAAHKTMYFRYYITKEGYNHSQPLRWSDLVQIHESGQADQEWVSTHSVWMPPRTGKHIVYSIWQRDWVRDAAEGFYQCVDVDYGNGGNQPASSSSSSSVSSSVPSSSSSSNSNDTCAALPAWASGTVYNNGNQVKHDGKRYQAQWWTQGQNPANNSGPAGSGFVWLDLGSCTGSPVSSSSSSVASSSSSVVSSSSSSVSTGNCTSPAYVDGSSYSTGAKVVNGGSEYQCTVGGWCTVGGPYAPGSGWAWTNAWNYLRSCN